MKQLSMKQPKLMYQLDGITPVMENDIKKWVEFNLEKKLTSSLKKIYSKGTDVEVVIKIVVQKVSNWYNGNFKFEYDGKVLEYKREGFEKLADLINHAFDNFTQRILAK